MPVDWAITAAGLREDAQDGSVSMAVYLIDLYRSNRC